MKRNDLYNFLPSTSSKSRALVVLLSGAGGWLPFVNNLSDELSKSEIDVLGFNSLRYFLCRQKSPQELAENLETEIEKRLQGSDQKNLILVGYSQGADVLPFVLQRFSKEISERVKLVVLIGLAKQADFKIRLLDLFTGAYSHRAIETSSEVLKISGIPILCVFGENDQSTLCRDLKNELTECQEVAGGHMFLTNWRQIAGIILKKINAVLSCHGNKQK